MKNYNSKTHKPEVVYVLVSLSRKTFLIAQGAKESLRETYRHHLRLRRDFSKNFIQSIIPERPCLFIWKKSILESSGSAHCLVANSARKRFCIV